jgi:hypothetical protein
MKRLLPFVFIAVTVAGCGTSASYKALVHRTYPVIADRMGRYPLTDQEKIEVQDLRSAAADQGKVKYETARPVWEKVEPDYRQRVGADDKIGEQRRADWQKTADLIDQAQDAEAERHKAWFGK